MIPLIELRGALPYSQIIGLSLLPSYILAVLGNIIPIFLVYFFWNKFLEIGLKIKYIDKLCKYIQNKGHKAGEKILEKSGNGFFIALLLFVAIPLPGTGAYTGILAATILDLDFKKSFFAISLGVAISGIIVIIITMLSKLIF